MNGPPSAQLLDAMGAVASGQAVRALEIALVVWRAHRCAEVADAIDRISAEAMPSFQAPKQRQLVAFQRSWLAVARDDPSALATGWLAGTLTEKLVPDVSRLPGIYDRETAYLERLSVLRGRAPDPRLGAALFDALAASRFRVWEPGRVDEIYGETLRQIVAIGDVRSASRCTALLAEPRARTVAIRDWCADALPAAIDEINMMPRTALPDGARWRTLASPPQPDLGISEDDLLAAIYRAPEDDGPRLVYADWLIERGSPRGEFISSQIARGGGEESANERSLLKRHRASWLGPDLSTVLSQVVFERGFPASATLEQNAVASPETWERAALDERLSTLHTLRKGRANDRHLTLFLMSPTAASLRRVTISTARMLETLLSADPLREIHHLELLFCPRRALLVGMKRARALTSLRSLWIRGRTESLLRFGTEVGTSGLQESISELSLHATNDYAGTFRIAALYKTLPDTIHRFSMSGTLHTFVVSRAARGITLSLSEGATPSAMAVLSALGESPVIVEGVTADEAASIRSLAEETGLPVELTFPILGEL